MIPKILHFFPDTNLSEDKLSVLTERYKNIYFDCNFIYWSEDGCNEFIKTLFPQYLTLFNQNVKNDYGNQLKKYLILLHYGGIYFDPDLFPLRSITGLISEKKTLLSFEPTIKRSFYSSKKLLSDTFLACTKQNSFVKTIIENLLTVAEVVGNDSIQKYNMKSLINRAYNNYLNKSEIIVIRSQYLQPLTKKQINEFDESSFNKIIYAYSVRLYDQSISETQSANILAMPKNNILDVFPLISCMCVSNNNEAFVKRCIKSFNDQLYENKELVIIYENSSQASDFINSISQSNIFIYNESDRVNKKTLGALRNIAIHKSSGQFVMQWDDDDIYDPHRIFEQYIHMTDTKCDACILDQVTIFDEIKNSFALSKKREWEGSIIFNRELSIANNLWYPELTKGEDTLFVEKFKSEFTIAQLSDPFLYLYVTHKNNTFNYLHHFQLTKTVFRIFKTYLKPDDQKLHYFKSFTN